MMILVECFAMGESAMANPNDIIGDFEVGFDDIRIGDTGSSGPSYNMGIIDKSIESYGASHVFALNEGAVPGAGVGAGDAGFRLGRSGGDEDTFVFVVGSGDGAIADFAVGLDAIRIEGIDFGDASYVVGIIDGIAESRGAPYALALNEGAVPGAGVGAGDAGFRLGRSGGDEDTFVFVVGSGDGAIADFAVGLDAIRIEGIDFGDASYVVGIIDGIVESRGAPYAFAENEGAVPGSGDDTIDLTGVSASELMDYGSMAG